MKTFIFIILLMLSTMAHAVYLTTPAPMQHAANAPLAISVTTSSATAVVFNINRTGLECTNIGTTSAFLAFGANAAIVGGGLAIPAGATWWMDDYLFTTQSVQMIAASTTSLACTEYQ